MENEIGQLVHKNIFLRRYRLMWPVLAILLCLFLITYAKISEPITEKSAIAVAASTASMAQIGTYFYSDLLPGNTANYDCILMSCLPYARDVRDKTAATWEYSLLFSAIGKNGKTNNGILPVSGYDFSRDIPIVVNTPGDTFLFFLSSKEDILPKTPVAQHTPEGWVWKELDCISAAIRRRALFFDVANGIAFDGTGKAIANLQQVTAKLPADGKAISVECLRNGDVTKGIVAYPALFEKQRPPLPYDSLYRYTKHDGVQDAEIWELGTVKEGVAFDPDAPTLAGKAAANLDDLVTYGKPVIDGQRIFYWYCIQQKDKPTYRIYILAYHDGKQAIAIDGYIVNPPNVRYWRENAWVKEERILEWDYQQQLGFPVQPIVGKDADGKIISYRPPELHQLEFIPDADKVQPKEMPAAAGVPAN